MISTKNNRAGYISIWKRYAIRMADAGIPFAHSDGHDLPESAFCYRRRQIANGHTGNQA